MIRETPITLANGLFAMATQPDAPTGLPVVVLLNAGLVHRVGPFRLYVPLARTLAAAGFPVVRFDQPGVGDAPNKDDPDEAGVVSRIFDELAAILYTNEFIVGGLCAAADLGWRVAHRDKRVRGLLLLDPVALGGWWFQLGKLRLFMRRKPSTWLAMIQRSFNRRKPASADFRDWPKPEEVRSEFAKFVADGIAVLAIYTGGAAPYFTHARQIESTFGEAARDPRVEFEYWPECDHTFMLSGDQARLIETIRRWSVKYFVPKKAAATVSLSSDAASPAPTPAVRAQR
ncbi:MAG TPA: alpha/beta fold hydrolase [Rhodanobacteraceae bacterium]